jgi:hypothetical protein
MNRNSIIIACVLLVTALAVSGCNIEANRIHLVDAKIAAGVDENLMPVGITDNFPKGTSKVSCWIKWENTKINTEIITNWHYITDDIHVLDYSFIIPKKEGTANIVLIMPNDKILPSGRYKADIMLGKRVLKSLKFRIE